MSSQQHRDLQERALTWVSSRATGAGTRGTCEIRVDDKYIADAVSFASLQGRYDREYRVGELEHAVLKYPWLLIFEVKVSMADYLASFRNIEQQRRGRPVGHLHWIVTTKELLDPKEIPTFWGLLEKRGNGLREIVRPELQNISKENYRRIIYPIGWEMLWHGRGGLSWQERLWEMKSRIKDLENRLREVGK